MVNIINELVFKLNEGCFRGGIIEIDDVAFEEATNELRELKKWVAVFNTEYDLDNEVVAHTLNKIERIAKKLGIGTL